MLVQPPDLPGSGARGGMQGGGTRTAPPGRPSRRSSGLLCSHSPAGAKATNRRSRSSRRLVSGPFGNALQGVYPPSSLCNSPVSSIASVQLLLHYHVGVARSLSSEGLRARNRMLTANLQAHLHLPHCCDGVHSDLICVEACMQTSQQGSTFWLSRWDCQSYLSENSSQFSLDLVACYLRDCAARHLIMNSTP